jgi:putative acetyltransferase
MKIRLFAKQDAEQVARLFHETVREINIRDYSSAQVEAWAPDDIYFRDWEKICSNRFTYVADDEGTIAGFGELEPNGHIDRLACFQCNNSRGNSLFPPEKKSKAFSLSSISNSRNENKNA